MKYPCSLIQDLLPLYHDGVCSEESNKIIEAHLSECSSCKDYYNSLCEADEIFAAPQNAELEMKKSSVFSLDKKKNTQKANICCCTCICHICGRIFFDCRPFEKIRAGNFL